LIPPWIQVKHFVSKVLVVILKNLLQNWEKLYGHTLCQAKTFVDISRFQGTTYKAANWIYLAQTKVSFKKGQLLLSLS
jgi:hypothetical protein